MWSRLKLFILTATPTAILCALWLFGWKPKRKSQNALKSSAELQGSQNVPTIEVTDTDFESQNEVTSAKLKSQIEVIEADINDDKLNSDTEVAEVGLESQTKVNAITFQSVRENGQDACTSRAEVTTAAVATSRNEVRSDTVKSQVGVVEANLTDAKLIPESEVAEDYLESQNKGNKTDSQSQKESDETCSVSQEGFEETQYSTEINIKQCVENIESELMNENAGEGYFLEEDCQNVEKIVKCSPVKKELSATPEHVLEASSFTSDGSQGHSSQREDPRAVDDICVNNAQMENGISESTSSHEPRSVTELSVEHAMENGLESLESVQSVESSCPSNAVHDSENSEAGTDLVSESGSETWNKSPVDAQKHLADEAGKSSDNDAEKSRVVYQFDFPSDLCGRLIGKQGRNVLSIREKSGADIVVKNKLTTTAFRVVVLEGTKRQVTLALRLIKSKFPESRFPNVNYTQTVPEELLPPTESIMQLSLPMGVRMDVIVSRVIAANHVFVQQPSHPTFPHLELQMQMLLQCYDGDAQTPNLPQPYEVGVVCVALIDSYWYRVQVISVCEETDECDVKLVDYGGYVRVQGTALKQIRRDFTTLPFQAIECYLFGVISPTDEEDFPPEAASVLVELVSGSILQAEAVAVEEDQVPYILLTKLSGSQSKFINRELVNRGVARWLEQ